MWESFYFSKDCLSRDERRKRKIGKEKERDTFLRGWNPFSNGSFDLSKEKRGKRGEEKEGIRCARGRHLGEYLCLVFAKHKRGMGMAERERERQFSSKGNVECENVASHFRVVTSNCTRKHWKFSRDRIFEREKEREFEYFTFALENFNRDECLFNTKIFSRRIFSFFFFFRRNRSRGGGAPIFSTLEQREIKRARIYLYRETRRIFSKRRFFLFFPLSLEFRDLNDARTNWGCVARVARSSSFARSLFQEILKFCAWNIEG